MSFAKLTSILFAFFLTLFVSANAYALPTTFVQEGILMDAQDRVLEGNHNISIRFIDAEAGQVLFEELHDAVPLVNGYYAIQVGSVVALDTNLFTRDKLHMTIKVDDGAWMQPYTEIMPVPAAMIAQFAQDVKGNINPDSVSVNGQVIIDENGAWVGAPTGLRGPQGEPGADGARGPKGDKGDQGETGPQGPAGQDGAQGVEGAQGAQGLRGSPDTPAEVLAKIVQVDGAGSALNADKFDGFDSTDFVRRGNNNGDASEFDGPLWVRGDHVRIGTQNIETGIQFLNTGTKNAGLRFDGNRTVFLEDASGPHPAANWYQPGVPTHLEVRNGNLTVNGRTLLKGSASVQSDFEVGGNVNVDGFIQPSAGDGNNGIIFPNASDGAGDLAYIKFIQDGGARDTALEIAAVNDPNDNIRLKSAGGVDIVGSGDLRAQGDVEIAQTIKVGGTSRLDGDVTMQAKASIADDATIGGDLSVTGIVKPSLNGGVVFPDPGGGTAKITAKKCGRDDCTSLELRVGDQTGSDRVTVYSSHGILLDGPGQGQLGLHWPNNRWGADGDVDTDAWIKYVGQGAADSQLQIEVTGNDDDDILIKAPGGITLDGNVRVTGRISTGGDSDFGPIYASSGDGDQGIVFPDESVGGPNDDAWIRYLQDGGNGDSALQIGISNDLNDEIEFYGRSPVEFVGPGNANDMLGMKFKTNYFGGAGDSARVVYFQDGGAGDTRLQIKNGGDQNDEIELNSNAPIRLEGPSTGPIGIQFEENRWGGAGDQAYLKYRSEGGENTVLELGIEGEADDNLVLKGAGGVSVEAPNTEISGNLKVNGSMELVGGIAFDELGINIGNDAPRATLDINGKTEIRGGNKLSLRSGSDAVRGLIWGQDNGPNLNVATSPGESIGFRDGSNGPVNLFIAGSGQVGVGTTDPNDALHVEGGGVLVGGGNTLKLETDQNTIRGYVSAQENSPQLNVATRGNNNIAFRDGGPDGDVNLFIGGALGNVGIGASDPNDHFKLRVAGQGRTAGHNTLFSSDNGDTYVGIAAKDKSYYLTARDNDSFAIHKPGVGDRLFIDDAGKVGIGTSAPTNNLHVNGSARFTDAAYFQSTVMVESGNLLALKTEAGGVRGTLRASEGSPHLDIATSGNEDIAFRDGGVDGQINMMIKGNGNIGIGTSNPTAKLEVNGELKASQISFGNGSPLNLYTEIGNLRGQLRASEGSPNLDIATSGGETIAFRDGGLDGDINMLINGAGNVGIGTANPGAPLHLSMNGDTEFRIQSPAGSWSGLSMRPGTGDPGWIWQSANSSDMRFYTSGADRMIVKGDGKVGIGTTNPSAALEVNGEVKANSFAFGNGSVLKLYTETGGLRGYMRASEGSPHLDIATSGGEDIAFRDAGPDGDINLFIEGTNGNVGIGTSNPQAKLHVNGELIADKISFGNGSTLNLYTEVGNLRGMLRASEGSPHFDIATSGNEDMAFRDGGPDGNINMFVRGTDGYVGIGTTDPVQRLSVNGDIRADGHVRIKNKNQLLLYTESNGLRGYIRASEGSPHLDIATSGGEDIAFRDGGADGHVNMFIEGTNGNVGIGTTGPAARLHVNSGGNTELRVQSPDNGYSGISFRTGEAKPGWIWHDANSSDMRFYTNEADRMIIKSNGRVGIGRNNPSTPLHVNGTIRADNHVQIMGKHQLLLYAQDGSNRGMLRGSVGGTAHLDIATSGGEHIAFRDGGADGTINMFIRGDGYVGIGRTNPSTRLHVNGTIRADNHVQIMGKHQLLLYAQDGSNRGMLRGSVGGTAHLDIATSGGEHIAFRDGGADGTINMFIRGDGHVGIGRTNPSTRLHVNGTIRADNHVQIMGKHQLLLYAQDGSNRGMMRGSVGGTAHLDIATSGGEHIAFRDGGVDGQINMFIRGDGFVGLGTTSPSRRLHVNGNARIEGFIQYMRQGRAIFYDENNNWRGQIRAYGGSPHLRMITSDNANIAFGDGSWDSANMFIRGTDGHVGIGRTNPSTKLHVNGTIRADNHVQIMGKHQLLLYAQDGSNRGMMRGSVGGTAHLDIATSGGEHIAFRDGGVDGQINMFIRGDGYVGIGTTSPATRLHVNGNMRVEDYIQYMRNGRAIFYDENNNWRGQIRAYGSSPHFRMITSGNEDISFGDGSWDHSSLFIEGTNDHVGIGTKSPADRLHVNGGIRSESHMRIMKKHQLLLYTESNNLRGYIRASEGSPHLDIATSGGEHIAFRDGGPDGDINMFVSGAGRVGIGTASPAEKLDVRGQILTHDLRFHSGTEFRIDYPENIGGGGGDDAWIRYYRESGENTRMQIGIANDGDDDINLYSNAMIYISGPGSNALGFDFQDNRWGGGGDDAYIRYERDGGGENTRLRIHVGNDGDDDMYLSAAGGITLAGNVRVTGNLRAGSISGAGAQLVGLAVPVDGAPTAICVFTTASAVVDPGSMPTTAVGLSWALPCVPMQSGVASELGVAG